MHLRDILRAQLATLDERFGTGDLCILETGTIRNTDPQYELDDGWSTVTFAEWTLRRPRTCFITIDLDILAADEVLSRRGLHHAVDDQERGSLVVMVKDHSIHALGDMLKCAHPIHLAYLDSDNDPTLILDEFLLVTQMMPSGGIVMIDDCDPVTGGHKGDKIIPWLKEHGQAFELVRRAGVGYATNVLIAKVS